MIKSKPWLSRLSIAGLLMAGVFGGQAQAATQAPLGITVSPAFQQVTIPQGAAQQPVNFTITNDKTTSQKLSLSVADFNTLNESGGLFFVGTNPTALQKKYGLAKWVSLPENQLTLQPKQTVQVQAQVLNLPTLTAGGHYGALMIAINHGSTNSANQVGLNPIASSLLFVTKPQGATYDLKLTSAGFSHSLFKPPSSVSLTFQDFGNTHIIPRGTVSVTDPHGRLVSKGIINEDSGIILPQATRIYNVPLSKVDSSSAPGRYQLSVDYRFDGYAGVRTYQASFYVIPPLYWLGLALLFAVVAVIIGWWLKNKPKKKPPPKRIKIVVK